MVVVKQNDKAVSFFRDEISVALFDQLVAKHGQQAEGVEGGLFDAVHGEHPQPAVEQLVIQRALLVQVGQQPVTHSRKGIAGFQEVFHDIRRLKAGVRQQIAVGGGGIPFGQVDGDRAEAALLQLPMDAFAVLHKGGDGGGKLRGDLDALAVHEEL